MFTIEQRERVHAFLLEKARTDPRVVAAAVVGALASSPGDRWSDLDLTFGVADGESRDDVLADWSTTMERELGAVRLFDLPHLSSIYRVFLLRGCLQVDLSFTPARDFGALGPQFALQFGNAVERPQPPAPDPASMLGLAIHHLVRARFCVERGRMLQAEYWISGARDHALALACLSRGLASGHARGAHELPLPLIGSFSAALAGSLERDELLRSLTATTELLLAESAIAGPLRDRVESAMRELTRARAAELEGE
jgi:hypothetical protein